MTNKQEPRVNKSKEQIEAELKRSQEIERLKTFLKEKIYPFVLAKGDSIENTKLFMNALSTGIKQAFNNRMLTTKVSDLDMISMLDNKSEEYMAYVTMFEMLKDETLTSAITLLEHVPQEIDGLVRNDNTTRKLADLNPKWL